MAEIAVAICVVVGLMLFRHQRNEVVEHDQLVLSEACDSLQDSSDRLTEHVRRFVESGGRESERDAYFTEARNYRHRELMMKRVAALRRSDYAVRFLHEAMEMSLSLMMKEYHAMRLLTSDERLPFAPSELKGFSLTDEERILTLDERRARAREEVFGETYDDYKDGISRRIAYARSRAEKEDR